MADTGATLVNTVEKDRYLSYSLERSREVNIKRTWATICHFGIRSSRSLGVSGVSYTLVSS